MEPVSITRVDLPRDRPCPLGEAQPGLSGLRGWLWRVVESQSVEWHRLYRGGRGVKIQPVSALEWNDLPGGVIGSVDHVGAAQPYQRLRQ